MQLHYVQLITDKTNAADLQSGVFTILISVTQTIKIQNSFLFRKSSVLTTTPPSNPKLGKS